MSEFALVGLAGQVASAVNLKIWKVKKLDLILELIT